MVLLTVLPVVITSSVISYYLIERPGIMIGRKCVAMFFPKQSPAQVIKPEATGVHPGLRSS
jgi:peptidoglycan/LPS O-acetylase OafA/YrhL